MTEASTGQPVAADNDRSAARAYWALLVLATVLGTGIRLYHLDGASFWLDELNTVKDSAALTTNSNSKIFGYIPTAIGMWLQGIDLSQIRVDNAHRWRSLGVNEHSARITSMLIGVLSIPILALASRRLLGIHASGWLALLLAVAPWHIYWSQAARFYTQQFLFYNLCLIWYFRATSEGSRARMIAALVMFALAFLSQPPALVLATILAADWLWSLARGVPVRLGIVGWVGAATVLAFCAVILGSDGQAVSAGAGEHYLATTYAGWKYQTPVKLILGVLFMVHAPLAVLALFGGLGKRGSDARLRTYLLLGAVIPGLAFSLLSIWMYVGLRYTFVSLYAWLALAALGIHYFHVNFRHLAGRLAAYTPAAVVIAALMGMNYGYFTGGHGFHTRWRDAFNYVAEQRRPGDGVVCTSELLGQFYLEDATVGTIPSDSDALRAIDGPVWIVFEARDSIGGDRKVWLQDVATLKAYFGLRVIQPESWVHVLYFDPAERAEDRHEEHATEDGTDRPKQGQWQDGAET